MILKIFNRFKLFFFDKVENYPYTSRGLIFIVDLVNVIFAFSITYYVCFMLIKGPIVLPSFLLKLSLCIVIHGLSFIVFRTFQNVIRYASLWDIFRIFVSVFCANLTLFVVNGIIDSIFDRFIFPNIGFLINMALVFVWVVFFRMCIKLGFDISKRHYNKQKKSIPLLIYGVNTSLAELVNSNDALKFNVVGFITSSDSNARNKKIDGLPIYYKDEILQNMATQRFYEAILINPSEIDWIEKQTLVNRCIQCKIDLFSTTTWSKWRRGKKRIRQLSKINIEDLLERPTIQIDIESIQMNLKHKTVLVTGAAGSIGSEIVRQISNFPLKTIILLDIAESPLHQIYMELVEHFPHIRCEAVICNTRYYDQLKNVFKKYKPDYVYHAAAYKHVPLMEDHPCEAVLTNVLGSKNAADLAIEYGVESFVMISTDKAVKPTNVMGATKRVSEIYIQSLSKKHKNDCTGNGRHTRFIITRFGNVLGSNGSVIPHFERQLIHGGPLTVTHPEIIRYFMTIPEACRLVLEAGNLGQGGEVFVFDMGEPLKIKDLAEKMIRLSGLEPYKDVNIVFTQLRPGEKLYEELLYAQDAMKSTNNPKIMIDEVREYDHRHVCSTISALVTTASTYDNFKTVQHMKILVPEYISQNSVYSMFDNPERG